AHSSAMTESTRSFSSGGGGMAWAALANMAIPWSSVVASARHPAHPRRCRRTAISSVSGRVPSVWSGSRSRTASHVMLDLQRLPELHQRRSDPCLRRAHGDALQLGHLGAGLAAEVGQLQGGPL